MLTAVGISTVQAQGCSDAGVCSIGNSFDNENWQTSNVFTNIESGIYTVYVKDLNGCGKIFFSKPKSHID